MANFIFTTANTELQNNTINPATDTFYGVLVTATPSILATTRSGLTEVGSPTPLTNQTFVSGIFSSDPAQFNLFSGTGVNGIVICKRAGSSPATSDRPVSYSNLYNSSNNLIVLNPASEEVIVLPGSSGWFERQTNYIYTSGSRGGAALNAVNDGIVYLMFTNNNTTAWSDQTLTKFPTSRAQSTAYVSAAAASAASPFKRSSDGNGQLAGTSGGTPSKGVISLAAGRKIKIGTLAIKTFEDGNNYVLSASNFNISTPADVFDEAKWEALGTYATSSTLIDRSVNSSTYYQYFRFVPVSGDVSLKQVEFFDSSIYSPNADLA
jgi:hypothetical protein